MPRPREAKPTAHLNARLKKSDHERFTTLANTQNALTALSIRRDVSDYLYPFSYAVAPIRLSLEKERERVSGYLTEGIEP